MRVHLACLALDRPTTKSILFLAYFWRGSQLYATPHSCCVPCSIIRAHAWVLLGAGYPMPFTGAMLQVYAQGYREVEILEHLRRHDRGVQ